MIEMKGVSKRYGAAEALSGLSFRAEGVGVIGLLGQNGAGKTTTLNILTGYLPPTTGQVLIQGKNMLTEPQACKWCIGYLPEKPPLYDEMTVRDYLRFVCELKGVAGREIAGHIAQIMERCGLTEVAGRVTGHLSKGYRQRVGVAQALCGDPPVIVLDEPTVGLDPRQVVEIRELIRSLGREHTVIFSSHILAEIQQLCDRVLILHHGRLVRDAMLRELNEQGDMIRLRASVALKERALLPALKSLPCVRRVTVLPTPNADITEVRLECAAGDAGQGDAQTQLFRLLCALDAPLRMLVQERDTLEDFFLRVTGGEEAGL